jgi:hypothetical protein
MRRYRVLLPLKVQPREGGSYEQHDEFDCTFTEDEETENVRSGLLAIVPVTYKVIGGSYVYETEPGGEFEMALPMGNEAQLIEGGHIERVETPEPAEKKPAHKTRKAE